MASRLEVGSAHTGVSNELDGESLGERVKRQVGAGSLGVVVSSVASGSRVEVTARSLSGGGQGGAADGSGDHIFSWGQKTVQPMLRDPSKFA